MMARRRTVIGLVVVLLALTGSAEAASAGVIRGLPQSSSVTYSHGNQTRSAYRVSDEYATGSLWPAQVVIKGTVKDRNVDGYRSCVEIEVRYFAQIPWRKEGKYCDGEGTSAKSFTYRADRMTDGPLGATPYVPMTRVRIRLYVERPFAPDWYGSWKEFEVVSPFG
jgi:hypothetical protein